MTEAWDKLVRRAIRYSAASLHSTVAETDAILQGHAEIERLKAELAGLKAAAPDRPDREALGRIVRDATNRRMRELYDAEAGFEWDKMTEDRRESDRCIADAVAAAITPAAPAAIVEGLEWMASFDRAYLDQAKTLHYDMAARAKQMLEMLRHPAAPGESGEAAEDEGVATKVYVCTRCTMRQTRRWPLKRDNRCNQCGAMLESGEAQP